jgi:type II secretory pathway pseudopilin PulG
MNKSDIGMHKSKNVYRSGFALIGALFAVLIIALLVTIASSVSVGNMRNARDNVKTYQAQLAAEAGLDHAVYKVWHEVWNGASTTQRNINNYKTRLANSGIQNNTPSNSNPIAITIPSQNLYGGAAYTVSIVRQDPNSSTVSFTVTSTGTLADGTKRTIVQTLSTGGKRFRGFDYALLTNNANCVFCHARIRSMSALGASPSASNPWQRAKVASLESLEIRPTSANTIVAGTIYTRGTFRQSSGTLTATQLASSTVKSYSNGTSDIITSTTQQNLAARDCTTVAACTANANAYLAYPTTARVESDFAGTWPDGELPDEFPTVVPDSDNNRVISNTEWQEAVTKSLSDLDPDNPPGSITGGIKNTGLTGVTAWPGSGNTSTLSSGSTGNVILDGTTTPLNIEGTVYIDGDVVIRGRVKGSGKIVARGNVYVLGDVTYACGTTSPYTCSDSDYTNPDNLPEFALAAIGNVAVGDFLTPQDGNHLNDASVDTGCVTYTSRSGCNKQTYIMREMTIFNRNELNKALANPSYIPRFYKLTPNQPVYIWSSATGEGSESYNNSNIFPLTSGFPTSATTFMGVSRSAAQLQAVYNRAVFSTVATKENWITPTNMKKLWNDGVERNSTRASRALRTDGLLYSANAVFALARRKIRNASGTAITSKLNGQWDLRGALVASDTGVLTPGASNSNGLDLTRPAALSIYYDERMRDFLRVNNNNQMVLVRSDWKLE